MAEIVNLRQARKRKRRAEAESTAAVNRAIHGRPSAETATADLARRREDRRLDAHRRDKPADPSDPSN